MLYNLKQNIKKNQMVYSTFRKIKEKNYHRKQLHGNYYFLDNKKNYKKICILLAGYKQDLWKDVFERIKRFMPDDMDFCVISSGVYRKELLHLCKRNGWSYLATKRNCVTLAQNIAIHLFPAGEYIYKLDEDIFVTENYFNSMINLYLEVENNSCYEVGIIAPLIPINGFSYVEVLKQFNMTKKYSEIFEMPKITVGSGMNDNKKISVDCEAAKFFWGKGGYIPHIDDMNRKLQSEKVDYIACPARFNIGAIMFPRRTWENMGMFKVGESDDLGLDEYQLNCYCVSHSKIMAVSKNSVVGHFSFGPQTMEMLTYYKRNRSFFQIKE